MKYARPLVHFRSVVFLVFAVSTLISDKKVYLLLSDCLSAELVNVPQCLCLSVNVV